MRKVLFFDTECYRNYFLVMFRGTETGKVTWFEFCAAPSACDLEKLGRILRAYRLVGFNSINYDLPLIFLLLSGADPSRLKDASDAIIVSGLKPWQLEDKFGFTIPRRGIDHIDLIEVAPGKASLKLYGGRMHSRKLQELPIDPNSLIAPAQHEELRRYCANDLAITEDLYRKFTAQLELRETMSREYGIDLRSKSDAQVAEAVISHYLQKATGRKPERPQIKGGTEIRYLKPDFISMTAPVMREVEERMCQATYVVTDGGKVVFPKAISDTPVIFGDMVYRTGIGGLHSCEQSAAHFADKDYVLIDRDVSSYYPSIILRCGLYPRHLGKEFLRIYKGITKERLLAKEKSGKIKSEIMIIKARIKELENGLSKAALS